MLSQVASPFFNFVAIQSLKPRMNIKSGPVKILRRDFLFSPQPMPQWQNYVIDKLVFRRILYRAMAGLVYAPVKQCLSVFATTAKEMIWLPYNPISKS